jgi:hypothetical protein
MEQVPCLLISNGEFTQITAENTGKYYSDKIKAMLTTKRHINYVILSVPQLPFQSIKMMDIQFTIVMGLISHTFTTKYICIHDAKGISEKSIFDIKHNCLIAKCIFMLHSQFYISIIPVDSISNKKGSIVFSLFAVTQALSPIYIFI